jgi:hypothetical protein
MSYLDKLPNTALVDRKRSHSKLYGNPYRKYEQTNLPSWNGTSCSIEQEEQREADQYYTNFIVGRGEFWQSPWILEWFNFLNKYPEGFFNIAGTIKFSALRDGFVPS